MCEPLFERLRNPINETLLKAKLNKDKIDDVILVGGSIKMPKIKAFVREMFGHFKKYDYIDPEEVIAYGATLEAEKILYNNRQVILNLDIFNVPTFSLGINVKNEDRENKYEGDLMNIIIKRGSVLPVLNEIEYETLDDNQTNFSFKIHEGDKKYVKYNYLLKEVNIELKSKAKRKN
jgi:molecular chaperone DnaK (HSP70)